MKKSWKVRLLAILTAVGMILTSIPDAAFVYANGTAQEATVAESTAEETLDAAAAGAVSEVSAVEEKALVEETEEAEAIQEEAASEVSEEPAAEEPAEEEAAPAEEDAVEEETAPEEETAAPEEGEDASAEETEEVPAEEEAESEEAAEPTEEIAEEEAAEPVEEEAAEEAAEEPEEEAIPEVKYPAATLKGGAAGIVVTVNAPEGAFPEGTKMSVAPVYDEEILNAIAEGVDGVVESIKAVDIVFINAQGEEIEPLAPISVIMRSGAISDDATIMHMTDDGAVEEVATDISGKEAAFVSENFSIYAIVETGTQSDDARLTVNFVQAGGETASLMITKRQADEGHLDQYIYDPGAGTLGEGQIFKGWTTEENYTTETEAKTIKDVRDDVEGLLPSVKEGDEVTYYAMIFNDYHIIYRDEKGVTVKIDQNLYRTDDSSAHTYTVNLPYTPYAAEGDDGESMTAEFAGWQQISPEVAGEEVVYQNGETITLPTDATDFILRAKVNKGYWLSFNENLRNASYTQPQFVIGGESPVEPADPTRAGYRFDGWYTEDASAERDGQVAGSEFDFSAPLTATTTVHGKWTENTTASYSVVIWKQNVSGEGYDFEMSVPIDNAAVGAAANAVSAQGTGNNRYARINGTNYTGRMNNGHDFTGFHLENYDTNVTVKAEGNSVVNVYYNRNEYTLTFRESRTGTVYKTITALYEQNIKDEFPITTNANDRWDPQGSSTFREVLIYIDVMPAESVTFYRDRATHTIKNIHYYVEALPGETATRTYNGMGFVEYKSLSASYNFFTEAEDYISLVGFSKGGNQYPPEAYNANGTKLYSVWGNSSARDVYCYYTRNTYGITYRDGMYVNGDDAPIQEDKLPDSAFESETGIKYGVSIADKGAYTPERDGYVFLGWYSDDTCTTEYEFTTMPANNITVYAKWVSSELNIVLHPNDSEDDPIQYASETQIESFYEDYGEKVGNVGGERIYYDLIGWYTDEALTQPYDFDAFVLNDTIISKYGDPEYREEGWPSVVGQLNLYAKWRSKLIGAEGINVVYDATDKGTNAPEDEENYTDLAEAIAGAAATSTDEDFVFAYWVVQKWNGTEFEDTDEIIFPGDTFVVKAENACVEDITDPTPEQEENGITKTYTIQVRAEYVEKDREIKTHIKWYYNYEGAPNSGVYVDSGDTLTINEKVDIPAAPTRAGYEFKGWIRAAEEGATTGETDLYLTYEDSAYTTTDGKTAIGVAADEVLVGGTAYQGMYAKWEPIDVDYTVEFYYQNADGETYTKDDSLTETRQAKTESPVEVTDEDKAQTKDNVYKLVEGDPSVFTATVAGDGSTVLKLYFDLNEVDVTVEHYLLGTTTAFKTATEKATVGTSYTATPETTYQEKNLTVNNYDPSQTITVATEGNVIKIYYTLPLTITAANGSKVYDGKPLDGSYTIEGALDADKAGIEGALGDAPSITDVGTVTYPEDTDAAKEAVTAEYPYYVVTITAGTLEITPKPVTITTGSDSKEYDGTPLTKDEAAIDGLVEGESVTLKATGTITEVGSAENTYSITWDNAKADNYTVSTNLGTLTITKNGAEVTLTAATEEKVYDGTPLTNDEVTASGLPEGFTVEATASGSQLIAGSSVNRVEDGYVIKNAAGEDKTADFTNVKKVDGTLTVTVLEVTVSVEDKTVAYNGETQYGETEYTFTNVVSGETATITYTPSEGKLVDTYDNGSYADDFKVLNKDGVDVTKSYKLTEKTAGKLTITDGSGPDDPEVDPELVVTKTAEEGPYDLNEEVTFEITATNIYNQPQTITLSEIEGVTLAQETFEDVAAGETITTTATYKIAEADVLAGSFTNTVTAKLGNIEKEAEATVKTAKQAPALAVTKTADKETYKRAETVKYEIVVENTGNLTITGITVKDELTGSVTPAEAFDLAPGESKTLTAEYVVTADDVVAKSIENVAVASGTAANKEAVEEEGKVTVATEKTAITIKAKDDEKSYDGEPLVNDGFEETPVEGALIEGDKIDSVKVEGSQTLVGSSPNKASDAKIVDADGKDVTAAYEISYKDGTLTVTDENVPDDKVVTKTDGEENDNTKYHIGDTVTWTIWIKNIYDEEKTVEVTENLKGVTLSDVPEKLAAGEEVEITATYVVTADDVEAGSIQNTVKIKLGDIEPQGEDTVETEPIEIEITAESDEKSYDATPLTNSGYKLTKGELAEGNKIDSVKVEGSQTLVGSSANKASDAKIVDAEGADVTKAYKITYVDGTLTVTDEDVPDDKVITKNDGEDSTKYHIGDTVTWTIWVKNIYDEEKTVEVTDAMEGVTLSEYPEKLAAGEEIEITATYVVSLDDVKAGSIKNEAKVKLGDIEKTGEDTVDTEKIDIDITAASDQKVYDGTPLTNDSWELTKGELAKGHKIESVKVEGSQTLVGSSDNVASNAKIVVETIVAEEEAGGEAGSGIYTLRPAMAADQVGDDVTDAYNINYVKGKLTVTDGTNPGEEEVDDDLVVTKEAPEEVFGLGDTVTFDITATNIYEDARTITLSEIEGVTLAQSEFKDVPGGETVTTTATYVITEADILNGSFTNTVTAKLGNITKEASATVETEEINGQLTIEKVSTSEPKNGAAYELGETISYKITVTNTGNVTFKNVKVTDELTGDEWTEAAIAPGESKEYTTEYVVTEDDILAGEVLNVATAEGEVPDPDPEIIPGEDPEPTVSKAPALTLKKTITSEPTKDGTYTIGDTITYKVTAINNGNVTLSNVVVEDPLTGDTFKVASLAPQATKDFEASYEVTAEDAANGSVVNEVTATAKDPKGDAVKAKPAKATAKTRLADAPTITPEPGDDSMTVSGKNYTVVYDGQAHSVTGKASLDGAKVEYNYVNEDGVKEWTTVPPTRTNVGTTKFAIRATKPGYEKAQLFNLSLTVLPREIVVTGESGEFDYTGKEITLEKFTVEGLLEGHKLTGLTYKASGTNEGSYAGVFSDVAKAKIMNGKEDVTANYTIKLVPGTLKIKGAPINAPKTGDTNNMIPYWAAFIAAALVLAVLVYRRRRQG